MSPHEDREWSIWSSSILVLGIRVISIVGQLATLVLLARRLTIDEFGLFAVMSACWVLARALGPLGADIAVLRLGSVDWREGGSGAAGLLCLAERQALLVVIPAGVVGILTSRIWSRSSLGVVAVAALVGVLWALVAPVITMLRAVDRVILAQAVDGLGLQVTPLIFIAMLAASHSLSLSSVYGAYALSACFTLLIGIVLLRHRLQGIPQTVRPDARVVFQLSLRLWQTQVFTALSTRAPVLLAGPVAGLSQTALVETAYKPQIISSTIAWAIGTNASPRYARAPSLITAMPMLRFSTLATLFSTATFMLAIAVGGRELLAFMGDEYVAAYVPMLVMIAAGIAEAPALATGYFFAMAGHERVARRITFVQFVTLIVGLFALLPPLGALGAAVALVCASTMRTALSLGQLHELSKSEPGVGALEIFWAPRRKPGGLRDKA